MEVQEQTIEQLRLAVERTAGMRMQTNKDFDCLAASIYDKTHTKISATTLKRFWGYLSEDVAPSRFTLNLLSQYVGYEDYETFCATLKPSEPEQPQLPAEDALPAELTEVKKPRYKRIGLALLALSAIVLGIAFILPSLQGKTGGFGKSTSDSARILQKGLVFATYDDFLPLFGITATESRHYQFVPGEEQVAEYTNIPLATIYQKLANREIPGSKPGKRWVIYLDEIDKWLEANRKNPIPLTDEEQNAAILASHKRKPNKSSWQTDPIVEPSKKSECSKRNYFTLPKSDC